MYKIVKHCLMFIMFTAGFLSFAQLPDIYKSLPTYPPKPEIVHRNTGPRPNAVVPDGAPSTATFTMVEYHPPQLRLLVRSRCGENLNRQKLIERAKREARTHSALAVDEGEINDERVSLWAVISVKKWQRRVSLQATKGKYAMRTNTTKEEFEWHVERVISSVNHSTCIQEERLEKSELWEIISSSLVEVWVQNKNAI